LANTTLRQTNNAADLNSAVVRQQRLSLLPDLRFNTRTPRRTTAAGSAG
jgi:hypothetical protein